MKNAIAGLWRRTLAAAFVAVVLTAPPVRAAEAAPIVAKPVVSAPVTLTDNGPSWTLDNGIVRATINKNNANMASLIYHGISLLGRSEFWEQTPSGQVTASVTIDPATKRRRTRRGRREGRERADGHRSALHAGTRRQRLLYLRRVLAQGRLSRRR